VLRKQNGQSKLARVSATGRALNAVCQWRAAASSSSAAPRDVMSKSLTQSN